MPKKFTAINKTKAAPKGKGLPVKSIPPELKVKPSTTSDDSKDKGGSKNKK